MGTVSPNRAPRYILLVLAHVSVPVCPVRCDAVRVGAMDRAPKMVVDSRGRRPARTAVALPAVTRSALLAEPKEALDIDSLRRCPLRLALPAPRIGHGLPIGELGLQERRA